ncbi:MAG: hypothetical protein CMJ58_18660 [Planctomycetaceae bacterium]|nr:hypothetical protein [Planctomycetaceae bacterium]
MVFWESKAFAVVRLLVVFGCSHAVSYGQLPLYTEGPGVNPPFDEIRDDITNGYSGTLIDVNNEVVEGGLYGALDTEDNLRLHTLANSSISESNFDQWSRWYQRDGATQIFRLFPGEENVRNDRPLAARVEAFDANTGWNVADGEWHDWVARYTIIKPINAAIFQAKDNDDDAWSVHLNMDSDGRVSVTHRRPLPGQPKTETLVDNAIGQPFDVRVRDNGLDYEVYFGNQTQPFASGQYVRNDEPGDNSDTRFRWGIYVGAQEVTSEAMIFVSHASVDPSIDFPADPDYGPLVAGWETWSEVAKDTWNATQTAGVAAQAVGTPEDGGVWFNFSNATVENLASSDGRYGALGPTGADATVDEPADGVTLSNGFDGFIDFTLTDATGTARTLTGFHFDVGAFRPNAATHWQLEVLAGSDVTAGVLATGTATVLAGPMQGDESINLTGMADNTLDAHGSVTFRLNFTGGGGDSESPDSGHHLFLDNVGVTGLPVGLPGDYDGDGDVDGADFMEWQRNDATAAALTVWQDNFGSAALLGAPEPAFLPVPEPSSVALIMIAAGACCRPRRIAERIG